MIRKTASLETTDLGTWGWEDWGGIATGTSIWSCKYFILFSELVFALAATKLAATVCFQGIRP